MPHRQSIGIKRGIGWKEGLYIATGVPVLVLPSIGYFGKEAWGFSVIIWILSVIQGFFHNTAYAEMAQCTRISPE